ncbi:hypothetical protein NNE57_29935, partial [Escherichia coli]|uniref:hypothetical protein n=1 Tax=Escherichia coli TaxID=562 RepID=UPI00241C9531
VYRELMANGSISMGFGNHNQLVLFVRPGQHPIGIDKVSCQRKDDGCHHLHDCGLELSCSIDEYV